MTEDARYEDLFVARDESGDLLPVSQETPIGTIKVYPMALGAIEKHFGLDRTTTDTDLSVDEIAEIISDHLAQPRPDEAITPDWLRANMRPLAMGHVLNAITQASGLDTDVDVDEDYGATVTAEGNE